MICESCGKKEVTVHYTEVVDGKMVEYHLCEDCARQKGFAITPSDAMAELMGSLAGDRHPAEEVELACPHCGLTLKELRAVGRLGCGDCYRTFASGLEPLLKALHKGTRHTGKFPASEIKGPRWGGNGEKVSPVASGEAGEDREAEIARLRKEVEEAVAAEDYERAARLRDRIVALGAGKEKGGRS